MTEKYLISNLVWKKWLNIAAINCAQQDCRDFNIQGTPTVRGFGPGYLGANNSKIENTGRDIPARHEVEYWYETILRVIENYQEEELELKKISNSYKTLLDNGLRNLMPFRYVYQPQQVSIFYLKDL